MRTGAPPRVVLVSAVALGVASYATVVSADDSERFVSVGLMLSVPFDAPR